MIIKLIILSLSFLFLFGCGSGAAGRGESQPVQVVSMQEAVLPDTAQIAHLPGKDLARLYCRTCHAFPEPGLLDKATWQKQVLPQMALRLGINPGRLNPYLGKSTDEVYALLQAGIFPQEPYISAANWQQIQTYYLQNAPEKLPQPRLPALKPDLAHFSVIIPAINKGKKALTTLIKFDSAARQMWVGDLRNKLFLLNPQLRPIDSVLLPTTPVDMIHGQGGYLVAGIGTLVPTDKSLGLLAAFPAAFPLQAPSLLLTGLSRPVQVIEADLDQDQQPDLIVCNYGNHFGSLVWYRNTGAGKYQPVMLHQLPGARRAEVRDLNHDGRPDVIALFGQGAEKVMVFYNKGKGKFEGQDLVQFPPVYGTNDFELVDFNRDGHLDILVVNGDNADFSFIVKPYHGIRIFLNSGKNTYREKYFYPLPGAWKALARDFDGDGDLDIAAISFYPDFDRSPDRGFVYLEEKGAFNFAGATFARSQAGRWFTMEAADYDQDGDADIILGSFINAVTPVPASLQKQWISHGPGIVVLQNTLANKLTAK